MSGNQGSYEARVAKTRQRFIGSLGDRLDNILAEAHRPEGSDPKETQVRKLHRMMHDMAGNAAMLELGEIETAIRSGLGHAESADQHGRPLTPADLAAIEHAIAETRVVALRLNEEYSA